MEIEQYSSDCITPDLRLKRVDNEFIHMGCCPRDCLNLSPSQTNLQTFENFECQV